MSAPRPNLAALIVGVCAAFAGWVAPARADVIGGGSDETIQQAYGSLVPGTAYSGVFTGPDDVDYLKFVVTSAGEALHFTVSNTMTSCSSPDQDYCPLYATLMDQNNQQVGGDSSSAGTVATVADTETIDWTFAQPGTYYLLIESNGNLPPGQPTYSVSYSTSPPPGGGAPPPRGGSPPPAKQPALLRSISVSGHQHGDWVKGALVLGRAARRLHATLYSASGRTYITSRSKRLGAPGRYSFAIRLPAAYRRKLALRHSLTVQLKLGIITSAGGKPHHCLRRVTLTG